MTGMIEGNSEYNDSIIKRLHKVCVYCHFVHMDFFFALRRTFNLFLAAFKSLGFEHLQKCKIKFTMRDTSFRIQIPIK